MSGAKRPSRLARIMCRLFGHDSVGHRASGGLPASDTFGILATCRRCGVDMSVWMPSRFTIYRREDS